MKGLRLAAGWEVVLAVAICIAIGLDMAASPYFLQAWTIHDVAAYVAEKAIVAFPLALLIIAREIDISVGGTIALASVAMGLGAEHGTGPLAITAIGVLTGAACGALNGVLVAGLGVPSIVVTIGSMSLFRGAAYAILGDRAIGAYPAGFETLGQGALFGPVSWTLACAIMVGLVMAAILHAHILGRKIYATGSNPAAALWSGVPVRKLRFGLFVAVGVAAGLASVFLTSRLGSTRPSIAMGWELDIVAMVILGGVSIAGGKGGIAGVALAIVLIGLASFGLGLLNIPGVVISMLMGALLILVTTLPTLLAALTRRLRPRSTP